MKLQLSNWLHYILHVADDRLWLGSTCSRECFRKGKIILTTNMEIITYQIAFVITELGDSLSNWRTYVGMNAGAYISTQL